MREAHVTLCNYSNHTTSGNMPEPEAAPEGGEVKPSESQRGPPPGVVPLFFSGPSQQIFGCVVDVDLTDENPRKLIPKEKILEDFKNRAAVCDFHPVKQKILVRRAGTPS